MPDNNSLHQKSESPWWPGVAIISITLLVMLFNPFLAIFLGLMLLFLNWLRMGQSKKVFFVSVLTIFVFVLWMFTDYDRSSVMILDKWGPLTFLGQVAFLLLGMGILVLIGGNDLRKFRQQAQEPKQTSKWTGLSIVLFLAGSYFITSVGLNYFSQQLGYCKFPTIYDLVAEYEESHVEGLGRLLAQRNDLGCGWRWENEASPFSKFAFPGERKLLDGFHNNNQFYHIEQIIVDRDLFDPSALDSLPSFEGKILAVNIQEIHQADFLESKCIDNGIIRECTLIIGFDHTVYGLDVRGVIFSDPDHFEMMINAILESAVARIVEYENSLP